MCELKVSYDEFFGIVVTHAFIWLFLGIHLELYIVTILSGYLL